MLRFRKISACRGDRSSPLLPLLLALFLLLTPNTALSEEELVPVWDVAGGAGQEPIVQAAAAVLLEAKSGRLLWQVNGRQPLPPASTTKIVTAITALDMAALDSVYTVSPRAAAVGESTIYLRAGEQLTLGDLVQGALVRSGNDAAYALAEQVAGSEPLFSEWLNLKSAALGAYSASFHNPHGLPAAGHMISAEDLAIITRYALANDFFAVTVAQKSVNIGSGASRRHLQNTNKLLWHDEEVNGVKTGTTKEAGPCLVASMESSDAEFISVVFNSPDRYGDCLRLLRYGAASFNAAPLFSEAALAAYVPVRQGQEDGVLLTAAGEVWCCYAREETAGLSLHWDLPAQLSAPVMAGQHVGSLRVLNGAGDELANVSLTAAYTVEAAPKRWWQKLGSLFSGKHWL